ncbi:thiol-disulfide isomerase/thioredoxin [Saccharothrix ecbatanensis]|uniref:Thiol-disulfide isomerase/thioredoxin n=1 Tax=Saccharothrix ecbatanensis TaxID=1105145 RepID=A0A7W9LZ31_9PSEU|nr:redoxin domain-containing protein [Saccharothrix ecbatanensis]MBB5801490.1 thiol-disulfide isomerase/thioredoxin [Saccharothrix ecbatanensis]
MLWKSASVVALMTLVVSCGSEPMSSGGSPSTTAAPTTSGTAATPGSTAPSEPVPAPSAPVPEQLKFTAKTVAGADFSGESLAGKPAVLWFWAPWCPNCQREAPGVAATAKDNGGVTFLGVAALDEVPAMAKFVDRFKLDGFAHVADKEAAVWKRFGVTAQPAYAFVGRDGKVDVVTTQLSEQELRDRVAALAGS